MDFREKNAVEVEGPTPRGECPYAGAKHSGSKIEQSQACERRKQYIHSHTDERGLGCVDSEQFEYAGQQQWINRGDVSRGPVGSTNGELNPCPVASEPAIRAISLILCK
jgi:hypothetical protein